MDPETSTDWRKLNDKPFLPSPILSMKPWQDAVGRVVANLVSKKVRGPAVLPNSDDSRQIPNPLLLIRKQESGDRQKKAGIGKEAPKNRIQESKNRQDTGFGVKRR